MEVDDLKSDEGIFNINSNESKSKLLNFLFDKNKVDVEFIDKFSPSAIKLKLG